VTIRRDVTDRERLEPSGLTRRLVRHLDRAGLWSLDRAAASAACAIGVFWAFIPLPSQMLPAAATAALLRANLPVTLAWVWIANPLTMPPIFYGNYRLGLWLLGRPAGDLTFEWTWGWLKSELAGVGPPLFLGSVVAGGVAAALGYLLVRGLWRRRAAG
jgi:uncharacterized protein (DUF2062 family)